MLPRSLRVLRLFEVDSTQDVAIGLVRSGRRDLDAVRADLQTRGRGRWGADWFTGKRNLAISYILWDLGARETTPDASTVSQEDHRPPARLGLLGLAAACSVAEAVGSVVASGTRVSLRWPNDVFLQDKKVAGVLVESVLDPEGIAVPVLGIGVNVQEDSFPPELSQTACSLHRFANVPPQVDALEVEIWEGIRERANRPAEKIVEEYRLWDCSVGHPVATPDGRAGIALGVGQAGGLLVRWQSGVEEEVPMTSVTLRVREVPD